MNENKKASANEKAFGIANSAAKTRPNRQAIVQTERRFFSIVLVNCCHKWSFSNDG